MSESSRVSRDVNYDIISMVVGFILGKKSCEEWVCGIYRGF